MHFMPRRFFIGNLVLALAAMMGIWFGHSADLSAATVSWDAAMSGGTAVGGTGNWATASSNWWSGTADQAWNNNNGDTAVFTGSSGTVTLGGPQIVGGVNFSSTGGYTLVGSTINFTGAAPVFSVATPTTNRISSAVSGTGPLAIQAGTGALVFTAANSYTAGTLLDSGTLSVNSDAALGTRPAARRQTSSSTAAHWPSPPQRP